VVDVTMSGMSEGVGPVSGDATARLGQAVIDTDDPARLAEFYRRLLGWTYDHQGEDWTCIVGPGGIELAFQLAINHRPPTWPGPEVPQQMHLDFYVDDLAAATARAIDLGAREAGVDAGRTYITLLDPSGHPFCLCLAPELRDAHLQ
jgi:catechol 2,3-dioxygenase-like lactoylglutathione lyase family enzyme